MSRRQSDNSGILRRGYCVRRSRAVSETKEVNAIRVNDIVCARPVSVA
jgi:hypothetical protein